MKLSLLAYICTLLSLWAYIHIHRHDRFFGIYEELNLNKKPIKLEKYLNVYKLV